MTKPVSKLEMDDATITELIQQKIKPESVTADLVIALSLMRLVPVMKEMVETLKAIHSAIAPDTGGHSLYESIRQLKGMLERMLERVLEHKK